MPIPNIYLIVPEIIIISFAIAVCLLGLTIQRRGFIGGVALLGAAIAFYASAYLVAPSITPTASLPIASLPTASLPTASLPTASVELAFANMFIVDGYGTFFKYIFYINLILTILISIRYFQLDAVSPGEYYCLLLLSTSGMLLLASSADLIMLYLGLELMTIPIYVLVGVKRTDIRCNESSLKYLLLGGFSSAFLLYGISLTYGITGVTNLVQLGATIQQEVYMDNSILLLGLILIVVGFAFKIALAPFHMWSPDVYEGAPTTVTSFMSVGPKAAGFLVLGRLFLDAIAAGPISLKISWLSIFWVLAILSMGYGAIVALAQTNIKRMLAYSSIAHAGYILLGIICATPEGLTSVMNYLMIYAAMNIGAFSIVILLNHQGAIGEKIEDYKGLAKSHPAVAFLMLIFMFSLAGIPPTAGFMAKLYLFIEVVNAGYTHLVIIAVLFSAISAFYYLRIVVYMYMDEPEREMQTAASSPLQIVIAITAVSVVLIGIFPSRLFEFVKLAVVGAKTL
jgi:NADH-quinone oxidoreductase subunit N